MKLGCGLGAIGLMDASVTDRSGVANPAALWAKIPTPGNSVPAPSSCRCWLAFLVVWKKSFDRRTLGERLGNNC